MADGPFYAPGRYLAEVVDQGLTKAGTGTVQIALKITVLEGTQPMQTLTQQYERTIYLPVTEKTMEYLVPKLKALGYTRDSLRFIDLKHPQCHDMRGTHGQFFCKHENKQDGSGLKEKWDVASTQSRDLELHPPDQQELRKLDMLFGRQLKQAGAKQLLPPPQAKVAPGSGEITDDDVPF